MCDCRWYFRRRRYHSSRHSMTIELSLIPSALAGPSTSFPSSRYDLKEKSSISIEDDDSPVNQSHFFIFILGHLQSRSFWNTYSDTFCRFANPFTTLSSDFRKIAFTWSVNFTDSVLLWSSMDLVADGTASRAITFAMTADLIRMRSRKREK